MNFYKTIYYKQTNWLIWIIYKTTWEIKGAAFESYNRVVLFEEWFWQMSSTAHIFPKDSAGLWHFNADWSYFIVVDSPARLVQWKCVFNQYLTGKRMSAK